MKKNIFLILLKQVELLMWFPATWTLQQTQFVSSCSVKWTDRGLHSFLCFKMTLCCKKKSKFSSKLTWIYHNIKFLNSLNVFRRKTSDIFRESQRIHELQKIQMLDGIETIRGLCSNFVASFLTIGELLNKIFCLELDFFQSKVVLCGILNELNPFFNFIYTVETR